MIAVEGEMKRNGKNPEVMSCKEIKEFNARYREVVKKRGMDPRQFRFGDPEKRKPKQKENHER